MELSTALGLRWDEVGEMDLRQVKAYRRRWRVLPPQHVLVARLAASLLGKEALQFGPADAFKPTTLDEMRMAAGQLGSRVRRN